MPEAELAASDVVFAARELDRAFTRIKTEPGPWVKWSAGNRVTVTQWNDDGNLWIHREHPHGNGGNPKYIRSFSPGQVAKAIARARLAVERVGFWERWFS